MKDPEFERLSRQIGKTIEDVARDLNDRGNVIAATSPWPYRDGHLLTIRKTTLPTEESQSGSFALKNDPDDAMVRIETGDRRNVSGLSYEVDVVPASTITPEEITARIGKFVQEWLGRQE
jgi:hypothetical protein